MATVFTPVRPLSLFDLWSQIVRLIYLHDGKKTWGREKEREGGRNALDREKKSYVQTHIAAMSLHTINYTCTEITVEGKRNWMISNSIAFDIYIFFFVFFLTNTSPQKNCAQINLDSWYGFINSKD